MRHTALLRRNLIANFLGTGITGLAAIISAPLVFKWFGAKAYGLVGVYLLVQGLMPLFDLGITPGLARAVACCRGNQNSKGDIYALIQLAQKLIFVLAVIFAISMFVFSEVIAKQWLKLDDAYISTAKYSIVFMGIALAFRMLAGIQKAGLMAIEEQVKANLVQSIAAISRTFGALLLAKLTESGILGFFLIQVPISALEGYFYKYFLDKSLPARPSQIAIPALYTHIRFSLGIAAITILWIMTTHVDKFALSHTLPLDEYGAYSLGVHIASLILISSGPIQSAVLPRLTVLIAAGDEVQARLLYGLATALTAALCLSEVFTLYIGMTALVHIISPDTTLGARPLYIALAYSLGNCAIAIMSLSYQLQNARGRIQLHAVGTVAQALIQIPVLVWVASSGDALRTAIAFALLNWFFALFWQPIVHSKFLYGSHFLWLKNDLLPPCITAAIIGGIFTRAFQNQQSVLIGGILAATCMACTMLTAMFAHKNMRNYIQQWWREYAR